MTREEQMQEELSTQIDNLNRGLRTYTTDEELGELLETAKLVKQYGHSAEESAFLQQMGDKIQADFLARRRRKRFLNSFIGAAAAVLLVSAVSFQLPSQVAREQGRDTETPQVAIVQQGSAVQESTNQVIEHSAGKQAQQEVSATKVTDREGKPANVVPPVKSKRQQQIASAPVKDEKTAPVDSDEQPLRVAAIDRKTADPTAVSQAPTADTSAPVRTTALLVLPGRSADSVTNESSGTIRQVYGRDTEQEVIVTQRPAIAMSQQKPDIVAGSSAKRTASVKNQAVRKVNGLEVVVEGRQPQAELERMADTLVLKEEAQPKNKE